MIIAELATKADLAQLRSELENALKSLRAELQSELRLLEQRMVIKLGAVIAGAVAIIAAIQKLF